MQRFSVKSIMRSAISTTMEEDLQAIQTQLLKRQITWITDQKGKLMGWLDAEQALTENRLNHAIIKCDLVEMTVKWEATLEEALSKMLGLGLKKIAVTDNDEKLLGEIWHSDIEKIAYQGDIPWK